MKLLPLITVVMMVLAVQTAHSAKQSVRASKENAADTQKITVKIIGRDGDNKPISSSTFTKNTDGLTKKLHVDFSKSGSDSKLKIVVENADGSGSPQPLSVSAEQVPKGAEIKIGDTIRIDLSKAIKHLKTKQATVETPPGTWIVASGTNDLDLDNVKNYKEKAPLGLLKYNTFSDNGKKGTKGSTLPILKDKLTKIYAAPQAQPNNGKITGLTVINIQAAGDKPVIGIDETGTATIAKQGETTKKVKEITELPDHVRLKAFLMNKPKDDLFISGIVDANKVQLLMQQKLPEQLEETPYFKARIADEDPKADPTWKSVFIGRAVEPHQADYASLRNDLQKTDDKVWTTSKETKARQLLASLQNAQ
jgi:hypothetical protein